MGNRTSEVEWVRNRIFGSPIKISAHFPSQNHETANVVHDTTRWLNQHHKLIQDAFHSARCNPAERAIHFLFCFTFSSTPDFRRPSGFKQDPLPDPKPRTSLHLSLPPPNGKNTP